MIENKKICNRCILKSSTPGVTINEEGFCTECVRDSKHPGYNYEMVTHEMEDIFARLKKEKRSYDVAVCFSGGKDSTYLLHMLKNIYNLKVLAFAIMHPFVNYLSSKNIDEFSKKLNIDLIKFHPNEEMFRKYIRYGLLEGHTYGLRENVGCDLCAHIYHNIPYRMAMDLKIPYLIDGSDMIQNHYKPMLNEGENIKSLLLNGIKFFNVMPDIFRDALGDEYKGSIYDFNVDDLKNEKFPGWVSPFSFMDAHNSYDYSKHINKLEEIGVAKKKETNPTLTNCDFMHFISLLSYLRYDCHPYEKYFAISIRKGVQWINQYGVKGVNTKEDLIQYLEEYKKLLIITAQLKSKTFSESDIETLYKELPVMFKLLDENERNFLLEKVLSIHHYAEYLDIDLDSLLKRKIF